jgi:hypothetical protein
LEYPYLEKESKAVMKKDYVKQGSKHLHAWNIYFSGVLFLLSFLLAACNVNSAQQAATAQGSQTRLELVQNGQAQTLDQATLIGNVQVNFLSDNAADSVDFFISPSSDTENKTQLVTATASSLLLETATLANGSYTLRALAYDSEQRNFADLSATFTVSNGPATPSETAGEPQAGEPQAGEPQASEPQAETPETLEPQAGEVLNSNPSEAGVMPASTTDVPVSNISTIAVQAKRADDFVSSIGVNIHLHYSDRVYKYYDSLIKPKLLELGVRHARDKAYTYDGVNGNAFYYQRLRDLAANGIRFNLLVSQANQYGPESNLSLLDDIYEWSGRSVISFEGPNEPDVSGVSNWTVSTPEFQKRLWQAVKGNSRIAHVKVIGPSPVWNPGKLGDLSPWLDYGNWHPYPGGKCPTCKDVYGNSLDTLLPHYRKPSGVKRMVITETGYHNALNVSASEGHKPASERAAGRYYPRLYLEYFNRGLIRTYGYEFIDITTNSGRTNKEAHFGLLRNDGTAKPAYHAIKNMIDLLEDPGSKFTTGKLSYALTGETSNVHTTLLQKRDGRFYLAVWLEKSSWDTGMRANAPDDLSARADLVVAGQSVTLTLGKTFSNIQIHSLRDDGSMSTSSKDASKREVALNVTDAVQFIELRP